MKEKKNKKILIKILFALFAGIFIFSAVMLIRSLSEFRKEKKEHGRLEENYLEYGSVNWDEQTVALPESPAYSGEETADATSDGNVHPIVPGWATGETTAPVETAAPPLTDGTGASSALPGDRSLWPEFTVNWQSLLAQNGDVIGWIWMYDSDISYPVLLGRDNAQYLYTTLDGKYAKFGSIFADYRSSGDFSDRNTIIYGHNGGYGVKFGGLMNYQLKSYWEGHRYVCMLTPNGMVKYLIYSAYITQSQGNPYKTEFGTEEDFQIFIDKTLSDSFYSTGIVPTTSDRILTLSTCTNDDADERIVVHAIRVN